MYESPESERLSKVFTAASLLIAKLQVCLFQEQLRITSLVRNDTQIKLSYFTDKIFRAALTTRFCARVCFRVSPYSMCVRLYGRQREKCAVRA